MFLNRILIFGSLVAVLSSCTASRAYFLSPMNGAAPQFRPMVLHKDSTPSAIDLTAALGFGSANDDARNQTVFLGSSVSRSHAWKNFGARYGASLNLGAYEISEVDTFNFHETVDPYYINDRAGSYFFGAAGIDGAFHIVSKNPGSEFRVLGVETTISQDFGNYRQLRKNMPSSAATMIDRDGFYGTIGMYTEIIRTRSNWRTGWKFGYGRAFGDSYKNYRIPGANPGERGYLNFRYFTTTLHMGTARCSGFGQVVFGNKGDSFQIGMTFRL